LAIYAERWDEKSRAYDGILDLLDALEARGIHVAVLSNKPHEATVRCVHRFFGDRRWLQVLGHREGHPRKPDPSGVHEILANAGMGPDCAVYLGDTDTDMQTAVAAGVANALVLAMDSSAEAAELATKVETALPGGCIDRTQGGPLVFVRDGARAGFAAGPYETVSGRSQATCSTVEAWLLQAVATATVK
jgi:phosphoglycolate phosphatase-like HAD superfamily hydrolase